MARKFRIGKHGLEENPVGAHVCYTNLDGSQMLGEVMGGHYRESPVAGVVLEVKHFNGEPWPFQPFARLVTVLEREYEDAA